MDFLQWFISIIQGGLIDGTGGSLFVLGLMGLFGLAIILWKAQATLPASLFMVVFALGIMSTTINPAGLFGVNDGGVFALLYRLVIFLGGGLLLWHLIFKRGGAGNG